MGSRNKALLEWGSRLLVLLEKLPSDLCKRRSLPRGGESAPRHMISEGMATVSSTTNVTAGWAAGLEPSMLAKRGSTGPQTHSMSGIRGGNVNSKPGTHFHGGPARAWPQATAPTAGRALLDHRAPGRASGGLHSSTCSSGRGTEATVFNLLPSITAYQRYLSNSVPCFETFGYHGRRGGAGEGLCQEQHQVGWLPRWATRRGRGPCLQTIANGIAPLPFLRLLKRCEKPDRVEFTKVARLTAMGFLATGFIGFFVKLVFIPINQVGRGGGVWGQGGRNTACQEPYACAELAVWTARHRGRARRGVPADQPANSLRSPPCLQIIIGTSASA